MSDDYVLGMNGGAYYGTGIYAGTFMAYSSLTELTNVRDVTISLERGEADVTTRANNGWRATAATLRDCSVDFEMVWKPGDAGFEKIKDAYLATGTSQNTVEMAFLDQKKSVTGAQGPAGLFSITSFSRSEGLEEAEIVSVTAKLATFNQWIEVT